MKCNYRIIYKDKEEKDKFGSAEAEEKKGLIASIVASVKDFVHKVADPKFEYEFLMSKLEGRVKFDEEGRFCSLDKMGKTELKIEAEILKEENT